MCVRACVPHCAMCGPGLPSCSYVFFGSWLKRWTIWCWDTHVCLSVCVSVCPSHLRTCVARSSRPPLAQPGQDVRTLTHTNTGWAGRVGGTLQIHPHACSPATHLCLGDSTPVRFRRQPSLGPPEGSRGGLRGGGPTPPPMAWVGHISGGHTHTRPRLGGAGRTLGVIGIKKCV